MLPIILNIEDKKDNVDLSNSIKHGYVNIYCQRAHIYVVLTSQAIVDRATAWLANFPFMQEGCEIISHNDSNETKIMHFRPSQETNERYWKNGEVHLYESFFTESKEAQPYHPNMFYIGSRAGGKTSEAFVQLAQILDDKVPQNVIKFEDWNWKNTNDLWLSPDIDEGKDNMAFKFNPDHFPIHITDNLPVLFDQILYPTVALSQAPRVLLIPIDDEDDDATSASEVAIAPRDGALSAALKRISQLEAMLRKCHIVEKAQADTIAQQAETIKALTDTHFDDITTVGNFDYDIADC